MNNGEEKILNGEKRFNSISNGIARKYAEINNLIEEIKNDSSREISDIVRDYGDVSNMNVQEKEQRMNEKLDEYQKEYDRVMKSDLSIEEKNIQEDEIIEELQDSIELYEEFGSLSKSEQDKEIDKKRRKIETSAKEQIEQAKNELEEFIVEQAKKEVSYLSYMLKKFNNQKEVYDAYRWLTRVVFDNDELTELYNKSLREALMKHEKLENIVIAYDSRNINIGDNYLKPLYGDNVKDIFGDKGSAPDIIDDDLTDDDLTDDDLSNDELIKKIEELILLAKDTNNIKMIKETLGLINKLSSEDKKSKLMMDAYNAIYSIAENLIDKAIKDEKEDELDLVSELVSYLPNGINCIDKEDDMLNGNIRKKLEDKIEEARNIIRNKKKPILTEEELIKKIEELITLAKETNNINMIKESIDLINKLSSEDKKNELMMDAYYAIFSIAENLIGKAIDDNNEEELNPVSEIVSYLPDGVNCVDKDDDMQNGNIRKKLEEKIEEARNIIRNKKKPIPTDEELINRIKRLIGEARVTNNPNMIKEALNLIKSSSLDEDIKAKLAYEACWAIKDISENLIDKAIIDKKIEELDPVSEIVGYLPDGSKCTDMSDEMLNGNVKRELEEKIKEAKMRIRQVEPIRNIKTNSNSKWKSIASIAAGIGIGVGVAFIPGVAGTIALTAAGAITKLAGTIIEKKRAEKGPIVLGNPEQVEEIENMDEGLKKNWEKFKYNLKYNSKKALSKIGDILTNKNFRKATTAAMVSSSLTESAIGIYNSLNPSTDANVNTASDTNSNSNTDPSITDNTDTSSITAPSDTPDPISQPTLNSTSSVNDPTGFKIGDSLEGYNLTQGNVTAVGAGTSTDVPLIQDILTKPGVHVGRLDEATGAIGVQDAAGNDLAWVTEELLTKGRSI